MKRKSYILCAFSAFAFAPLASAQFDTAAAWGDADPTGSNGTQGGAPDAGTDPVTGGMSGTFTSDGTTTTITSGGFDFWTANDGGTFVYDSGGAFTTTGDFTASVRHVEVNNNIAANWGRTSLFVRATQSPGTPAFNDANVQVMRRSNGLGVTGWRDTVGGGTGRNDGAFPQPSLGQVGPTGVNVPAHFAVGRTGSTITSAFAMDIGGAAGRWVQHADHSAAPLNGGNEVIVGLGHQAHNEGGNTPATTVGSGGGGRINTATFDNWTFSSSYDQSFFSAPAGQGPNPWTLEGSLVIDPAGGNVSGSAYVSQGGAATGEPLLWTVSARQILGVVPGLNADVYLTGNPGNQASARNVLGGSPSFSLIVPDVDWTGNNGSSATNPTPYNQGEAVGDFVAAAAAAGQPFSTTNQENYGVHLTGEIFIPGDADRLPGSDGNVNTVAFKDGVDDYTFVGIDGMTIVDDNSWTGYDGTQNGGSPIATLNVSDPKYDDGEWVSFEMMTWEGGGGDAGVLYWDQNAAGGFPAANTEVATTAAVVPDGNFRAAMLGDSQSASGMSQVGSEASIGSFGLGLAPGEWEVTLGLTNTAASSGVTQSVLVTGGLFQITEVSYNPVADTIDLTFPSFAGANYLIESSTDLEEWIEVDDSVLGQAGMTTVSDIPIDPPGATNMNYRVRFGVPK